ncbi:MAG: VTC domain-containing protein [Planctomycetes bacterium]|nr:VTC domain-containing protein [Planctomycetota bacterium]
MAASLDAVALTLRDEAEDRPDIATRDESKYVFTRFDTDTLRAHLRGFARPIVYAGPVSRVFSLYFDDARLSACRANLDGLGVRHKLRLRWYDQEQPAGPCFFEIKWRNHQTTGKHRFRVTEGGALLGAPLRQIPALLARALPARFEALLLRDLQAVNLVEYRREHFGFDAARFTLDYDLRFHPLLDRRHLARRFGERLPGVSLIECKAPLASAGEAQRVLRGLRTRSTSFSKYVTACLRLGLVSVH